MTNLVPVLNFDFWEDGCNWASVLHHVLPVKSLKLNKNSKLEKWNCMSAYMHISFHL